MTARPASRASERRKARIQVAEMCLEEASRQLREAVRRGTLLAGATNTWAEAYDDLERARKT